MEPMLAHFVDGPLHGMDLWLDGGPMSFFVPVLSNRRHGMYNGSDAPDPCHLPISKLTYRRSSNRGRRFLVYILDEDQS